jgi:hypothetical protein
VAEPADRDTAGSQHSRHLGENANHHSFIHFPFLDPVLHQEQLKAEHVICLAVRYIDGVSVCHKSFLGPKNYSLSLFSQTCITTNHGTKNLFAVTGIFPL